MDWQLGDKVPYLPADFDVWLTDGSVRKVHYVEAVMGGILHFMDCTHPLQNVYCPQIMVRAWRLSEDSPPMTWDRPVSHPAYKQEQREKNASIRALVDRIAERCPMTDEIKLPEPAIRCLDDLIGQMADGKGGFTADQVRAAVLEAKAQERERCAKLCDAETQIAHGEFGAGWVEGARTCAAAIRSGHSITETQRAKD